MKPLFFLSYARNDESDGQQPIRVFFDNLLTEVAHYRGTARTGLGFIDAEMLPAEHWKHLVRDALCETEVLLCLLSPYFYSSDYCGREWALFERRMAASGRYNRILPVIWSRQPGEALPGFASEIQFTFDAGVHSPDRQHALARYQQRGLRDLARHVSSPEVKRMYDVVVEEIALRIIQISRTPLEPLSARDVPSLDAITPKFPEQPREQPREQPPTVVTKKGRARRAKPPTTPEVTEREWDTDELGAHSAASTRDDAEICGAIARITGLSKRHVQATLRDADGRARVWKLFEAHWPSEDEDEPTTAWDIHDLGARTAASVREDDTAIAAIAEHTEVHTSWVKRRLGAADGRTRVRSVFVGEWPEIEEEEGATADPEDQAAIEALGMLTAAAAREDQAQIDTIGRLIHMAPRWVRRLLNAADGRTHVRNVFASRWPGVDEPLELSLAELGAQRAAWVRDELSIIQTIAALIGMDERWVRRLLNAADGRACVRKVFADRWPTAEGVAAAERSAIEQLGAQTAASARDDEQLMSAIATITQLEQAQVQRRLANAHGRMHVRKVFARYWPEDEEDEDSDVAETLGAHTAASARDDEAVITAIASLLGLSPRSVQRTLAEVDGRYRVRTVFAARWP